jgi:hypothetical protein
VIVAAGATMVIGLVLLVAAWWLRPIAAAERALANGNLERAVEQYSLGRRRVALIPFVQNLVPGFRERLIGNELLLQYALRRYDRILEGRSLEEDGAPEAFWAGCVLFDKALVERDPKARLEIMTEAQRTFRRALELNPDDWDTKFNFEVAHRLQQILQRQPDASQQEIIKILRDRGVVSRTGRRTG